MEDDLCHFLRSRDVPEEDIMQMQRDKVNIINKTLFDKYPLSEKPSLIALAKNCFAFYQEKLVLYVIV